MTTANLTVIGNVLFKRGNTTVSSAYTGVPGEIIIDTTLQTIRIQDGVTAGGHVLASAQDAANIAGFSSNIATLLSNAATQASQISSLQANAALQASLIDTLSGNAATQGGVLTDLVANAAAQSAELNTLLGNAATQAAELNTLLGNAATQTTQIDLINANIAEVAPSLTNGAYQLKLQANGNVTVPGGTHFIVPENANIALRATGITGNAHVEWHDDATGDRSTVRYSATGVEVYTTSSGVQRSWLFHPDGSTHFPQYTFPLGAGAPDSYLKSDGVGGLNWVTDFGNVIPAANVTYSLGSEARQWKDLWVSNNTIYIGGIPVRVDGGTLLVNNTPLSGAVNGNIAVGQSEINFVASSSGDGFGFSTIELRPDTNAFDDSYLIIDPTYPSHIHIRAGGTQDNSLTQLFLGGENSHFRVDSGLDPTVYVRSNNNDWTFGTDGNLTLGKTTPHGGINRGIVWDWGLGQAALGLGEGEGSNSYIRQTENGLEIHPNEPGAMGDGDLRIRTGNVSPGGTSYDWIFNGSGGLTFPTGGNIVFDSSAVSVIDGVSSVAFADSTVQTTAWTGTVNFGNTIAIGYNTGTVSQGSGAVAIGSTSGNVSQGIGAVAVGESAGRLSQGTEGIAIGKTAGEQSQGSYSIAIGSATAYYQQGLGAVAIGTSAGALQQGNHAIAIGTGAGNALQGNNSIILNATGDMLDQTTANTFTVAPIRNVSSSDGALQYNATTKEVSYNSNLTLNVLKIEDGVHEKFQTKSNATGTVTHDCSSGHIFYHTLPSANWTANFTNLNLSSGYATSLTLVIEQGATGYYPSAVEIGGSAVPLAWQGNTTPTPSSNRIDVVTFSILNDGLYTVLGQLTGF